FHPEFWTALATIFIAAFTYTLKKSTDNLWAITSKTLRHAEDTARRQLRAYLSLTPKDVINWTNPPHRIGVKVDLKNHGRTPGFESFYNFSMVILDAPLPADFVWPEPNMHYDQNNTVFPDEVLFVRFFLDRDLTLEEVNAIESGAKRFHTRGTMRYRDAFKELRTTKLSFSFVGPDFALSIKG